MKTWLSILPLCLTAHLALAANPAPAPAPPATPAAPANPAPRTAPATPAAATPPAAPQARVMPAAPTPAAGAVITGNAEAKPVEATAAPVRKARRYPRGDLRACLDQKDDKAIIRCANRGRP
jgi:hypothetical protein